MCGGQSVSQKATLQGWQTKNTTTAKEKEKEGERDNEREKQTQNFHVLHVTIAKQQQKKRSWRTCAKFSCSQRFLIGRVKYKEEWDRLLLAPVFYHACVGVSLATSHVRHYLQNKFRSYSYFSWQIKVYRLGKVYHVFWENRVTCRDISYFICLSLSLEMDDRNAKLVNSWSSWRP